jgi:integral membrane protein
VKGAFQRYRVMAYLTGFFLAGLTVWALVGYLMLDYGVEGMKPKVYSLAWTAHGLFYFLYLLAGVDLAFRMRYGVVKTLGILVAGTIPFMSFVAEHFVRKDVVARGVLAG